MSNGLRKCLLLILTASLSPIPVPWIHSHAGLSPRLLRDHLARFHSSPVIFDELPQGLHFHFFWVAGKNNNSLGLRGDDRPTTEKRIAESLSIQQFIRLGNARFSVFAGRPIRETILRTERIRRRQRYLTLQVFLI